MNSRTLPLAAAFLFSAIVSAFGQAASAPAPGPGEPQWFKGNLHTHSLWSDGDDYPEMIGDWYKRHGYQFLALSDHNTLHQGERWFQVNAPIAVDPRQRGGGEALQKYLQRFGPHWVEQREQDGKREVRLKPLGEYRALLEEAGRYLLIPSEEISSSWKRAHTETAPESGGPIHVNATNLREFIAPVTADNAVAAMQQTIDAVNEQRSRTGQPMFSHINHPNFRWAITAEDLMQVRHERFFEIYNGHNGVNNQGDATHLDMDAMWDAILTFRLAELKLDVMYGIGVDDSHYYHAARIGLSNSGRGWIMVRARQLTPESIVHAMEAGDFYASSGVTLTDVVRTEGRLAIEIQAEPGVTYVTQFIGTRRGFDPTSELIPRAEGTEHQGLPHRRYSKDIGAVLAEVKGTSASYPFKGDEIYVRAKIVSSKPKPNASVEGEFETAWTQPAHPAVEAKPSASR